MTRRRTSARDDYKKRKAWTIVCLILVCAAAILLRGVAVYKLYPLKYQEQIKQYSEVYNIDAYFVSAVICAESGFDQQAISSKGAIGLMQIMPDTGEWAAGKIGIENYSLSVLNEPDTNIQIGCWYLGYLRDKFDGDPRKVLAAYNAGPSNVGDWLVEDSGLENIPFEETDSYIEKVQNNYEIYKGLYNDF